MRIKKVVLMVFMVLLLAVYLEDNVFARAGRSGGFGGGSSSYGSRGSRTYSSPSQPSPGQNQSQPVSPLPQQSPSSGGFLRNLAGGLAGGFLGSLLFSSLGFGGGLGGGMGIFPVFLLALGVFVIFKLVASKKRASTAAFDGGSQQYNREYDNQHVRDIPAVQSYGNDLSTGLDRIRQYDPSFDEAGFKETVTNMFFKIQAAWMNRDIESSRSLFAPEILEMMRSDAAKMKSEGRVNRLENIAMRNVEMTEAWQEQGKDYISARITANVLDYVTDDQGSVLEGSKTEPVKFMEYWTFVKPVGTGAWQLTAIQQTDQ